MTQFALESSAHRAMVSPMRHLLSLLIAFTLFPSFSSAEETRIPIIKRIELWTKRACAADEICLPAPLGIGWDLQAELHRPANPGSATQVKQSFQGTPYVVEFTLYWARPRLETQVEYLVTQIRLSHETLGLIAECSRYDDARASLGIATGSCSSVANGEQIGVSVANPPTPPAE